MHWTIFKCNTCRNEITAEHVNKRKFITGESYEFFCNKCNQNTTHFAIKQFLDSKLLD